MFSRIILLAAVILLQVSAHGAEPVNRWQSVRQLPHHASFLFMKRDQTCYFGEIQEVTNQEIVIRSDKQNMTIARADLFRIERGRSDVPATPYQLLTLLYSGRSSWADIMQYASFLSKYPSYEIPMSVATTTGKVKRGRLKEATEGSIVLQNPFGEEFKVPKAEVSSVDRIQSKPLSDQQELNWEELAPLRIFDPGLYPRMFNLGDTFPVRLYDRMFLQDDSAMQCR